MHICYVYQYGHHHTVRSYHHHVIIILISTDRKSVVTSAFIENVIFYDGHDGSPSQHDGFTLKPPSRYHIAVMYGWCGTLSNPSVPYCRDVGRFSVGP